MERTMKQRNFIDFLNKAEKLKCNTRHSWTSSGRHESVAEHSWRLTLMALLCGDEYPDIDINKVIKMCIIHDLGEAITGDIPAFNKTDDHREAEKKAVMDLFSSLPDPYNTQFTSLFDEMEKRKTPEAMLFKSLDNMEALISHNEADISTWLPIEYINNFTYGKENCEWSAWTKKLKEEIDKDTQRKIDLSKG